MSAEAPIVIDDSSDEDYIPPSHLKPASKRNQTRKSNARLTASPTKQRNKIKPEPDDPHYSFMTKAQTTASASRKNQVPITQFFTSPGKKPLRQPGITSFFSGNPTVPSRPMEIGVILPETDSEPLAPLPSPFIYRSPSPTPTMFGDVLIPSSTSTINGEVVKTTLKRTLSEVTESLSNSTAKSADSPPSKFVAIRSFGSSSTQTASTVVQPDTVNKRVWAAVPAVQRGLSNPSIHIPPPASTQPTMRFIDPFAITSTSRASLPSAAFPPMAAVINPIPRTPTPASSAFVSGFKAVPTQPRRTPYTPVHTEPFKMSCERCNLTFMATTSTATNPAGDGFLCPVCAFQPTIITSSPRDSLDDGDRTEHPSALEDRCADLPPDSEAVLVPAKYKNAASGGSNQSSNELCSSNTRERLLGTSRTNRRAEQAATSPEFAIKDGSACVSHSINPVTSRKSTSSSTSRPVKQKPKTTVSPATTLSARAAVKTSKKMKLYTVESMSVNGSYGLKSVQDTQETPEDEIRRRNARKYKAEYRARQKGGVAASSPPTVPSVTVITTAETAVLSSKRKRSLSPITWRRRKITVTTPGACEVHDDLNCTDQDWALLSSRKRSLSPITWRRREITVIAPGACEFHGDLDCTDQDCASDFFEDYDPFNEAFEVRSEPIRTQPDTKRVPPQRTVPEQRPALDNATKKNLREIELAVSLVARDGRQRRPYITHQLREFVRRMGCWSGFLDHVDCIIHVDFTPAEAEALRYHISNGVPAFNNIPIDQEIGRYASISISWRNEVYRFLSSLPGRIESDVIAFIEECKTAFMNRRSRPLGESIIRIPRQSKRTTAYPHYLPQSRLRLLREAGKNLVSWGSLRELGRAMELRIRDTMPAWKVFTEGSSDILDICWSPDGQRFGLGCCTFDDQYNRPGNLMLGSLDSLKIRMLDGHKVPRQGAAPQAVLDRYLYSTVSSVKYSRGGQLLFSGSYDETVKIWLGEDGTLLNSINLGSAVSHLATSPMHHNMISAGCKDGNVSVLHIDPNGNLETSPVVFQPAKQNLEAATLAWCNNLRPNWLIAGYDNRLEKGNSGDLLIFDIKAEKVAENVMPGSTRQFDVFLDEEGTMFATAAVAGTNRAGKHIKTQIRLYNLDGNVGRNTRSISEFDCEKCDINKVTVSPCEIYVTASGTDGSTTVWDRRNPNQALHNLKHGNSLMVHIDGNPDIDDTGVTCAFWGPTNDRFYTGGSDGAVKAWDIKRGDPFIRDFAMLNSQIMSGAFSPEHDMLIIGECSGKATLFSTRGDRGAAPGLFDVDISDVTGDVNEEKEETGADAARALVKSGKMVVRDHFAWATGL